MQIFRKPLFKTSSKKNGWWGKLTLKKKLEKEIQFNSSRDRPRPLLFENQPTLNVLDLINLILKSVNEISLEWLEALLFEGPTGVHWLEPVLL